MSTSKHEDRAQTRLRIKNAARHIGQDTSHITSKVEQARQDADMMLTTLNLFLHTGYNIQPYIDKIRIAKANLTSETVGRLLNAISQAQNEIEIWKTNQYLATLSI